MPLNFGLDIDTGDFNRYSATLVSVSKLLQPASKAWGGLLADIGDYFIERIQEEFDAQGQSTSWPALSPDYESWKSEHYGALPILYLSGEYESSFKWDDLGDDAIIIHTPEFEETRHMAHTFGTEHNQMPARPPFVVTNRDLEHVDEMFADHFDAVIFSRL